MLCFKDLHPLTHNLPPVLLLSSTDSGGGGAAALRTLQGLRAAGADACMLVIHQKSTMQGVVTATVNGKSAKTLYESLHAFAMRNYRHRPYGYEAFYTNTSVVNLADFEIVRRAGLLHLHWIAGLAAFPLPVVQDKPLVWTLHDMNAFTGGCICTAGCGKFVNEDCAQCPQLDAACNDTDLAAENFIAKRNGYAGLSLHVVTPSAWLGGYARKSALLGSFPQTVIPNSIQTKLFLPMPQLQARAVLDLPLDAKIILFSASDGKRRNKGLHVLLQGLELLRSQRPEERMLLLILGETPGDMPVLGYACRMPGFIEDTTQLAAAYSAADVFVLPSFQDNLPNTLLEAQSCGTPGIGFYGTGAEDIIQDGITGYLAQHPGLPLAGGALPSRNGAYFSIRPNSVEDLAAKIGDILDLPPDAYTAMRHACRQHALGAYTPELQAARYLTLYRHMLRLPEIPLPDFTEQIL